ncbi:uncharacterized protein I303_103001 [Kwoniella dejecticola CBS 10117]|uniref:Uncharacterized protein n=1 Tax=Kwoniella dejecticola CBS 10117 TaxID=1296121 RepID=A0A1A6AAB5_9TREE|nr:uncharacterized protein I303_03020 [Kwoniella dejecticola CBS 10117]OBR86998.1 hypothetical protein I303_03020 [Kwoniella dejecticola CBS 10117]
MQSYQPPHARQRTAQNAPQTSNATSAIPPASPGPTPKSGSQKHGDEILRSHNYDPSRGISYANANRSDQAGPSSCAIASPQPVSTRHSGQGRFTPRMSKKDWSTPPPSSSFSPGRSALASPAGDIKPMRKHMGVPTLPRAGEDDSDFDFELIQSVSRSGGDGAEGDALKDWDVQDKYRVFIDRKIKKHHSTVGSKTPRHTPPGKDAKDELESLGSIVLLFRKLREGVVASHRIDDFAIEVFETSAQFAILANNRPQLISSLSGLVPGLYNALDDRKGKATAKAKASDSTVIEDLNKLSINDQQDRRKEVTSLFLLYQLVILGEKEFWSSYFELTSPCRRKTLRQPFDGTHTFLSHDRNESQGGIDEPFIDSRDVQLAVSIARSISPHSFDPIRCFRLLERATTYERAILAWGEYKIRERAWELLKKAYMSTGIGWAGRMLGVQEDEVGKWVMGKEARVDQGIIKLR